ncbi:hypothetical protein SFC79_05250 [Nocardioides sp. S-58]|uniref:GH16 domain-containing protein n=1 Tax=Nocardioides renjunii TaxID=3095075 RepID=A0ABU5K9L0_9ACTN|nr:hypothetical protein [Nocardioides sp. S-58]MDZ5661164.1 hypothetical protein [Nocardioides sp. S-58]
MSRLARQQVGGRTAWRAAVLVGALLLLATACIGPGTWPTKVSGPRRAAPPATTAPTTAPTEAPPTTAPPTAAPPTPAPPAWETLFADHFDGPAGTWPDQWHHMTNWNAAALNGLGQLEVGHVAQIRSTPGWMLPAGTRVRVSASLVMPDTSRNYAALWVQHPNPVDPREIDVIESYGPRKVAGAQLGSHICYDESVENDVDECGAAGLSPELWPVGQAFADGAKPWETFWEYHAEFTVGGEQVHYEAKDGSGNQAYTVDSTPDARRVPGNAVPFHLRLSNKDVEPEHMLPGGSRHSMFVDWVTVQVLSPTAAS